MILTQGSQSKVAIADVIRTPFCIKGGSLASYSSMDLAVFASSAILKRNPNILSEISHAIFASPTVIALGSNPALSFARRSGLPIGVTAHTVSSSGCSAIDAVICGANLILSGQSKAVLIGMGDSVSMRPYLLKENHCEDQSFEFVDTQDVDISRCPFTGFSLPELAEDLCRKSGYSTDACEEFARSSIASSKSKAFSSTALADTNNKIATDQDVNVRSSNEKIFGSNGILTELSCATICDGGAAVLLTRTDLVRAKPELHSYHSITVPPEDVFTAQSQVVVELLGMVDDTTSDSIMIEIDEYFSSQGMKEISRLGTLGKSVNRFGGDLAFGVVSGVSSIRSMCVACAAILSGTVDTAVISAFSCGGGASGLRICGAKQ